MCLDRVITTYEENTEQGFGYKYLEVPEDGDYLETPFVGTKLYPNQWIRDGHVETLYGSFGGKYSSGFHIFTDLEEAQKYPLVEPLFKVRYRGIIAEGIDAGCTVVVTKEIMVLEKIEEVT